jgi:hypothetical protein
MYVCTCVCMYVRINVCILKTVYVFQSFVMYRGNTFVSNMNEF